MNKPILCCLKIKPATLFIGCIDLLFHFTYLIILFASFSHPNFYDHYYANSISLVASSSSNCFSTPLVFTDQSKSDYSSPVALPIIEQIPSSNQNLLNNPLGAQLVNEQRHSLRHLDGLSSLPFSLSSNNSNNLFVSKDKSIVLLITIFSSFITIMLIYGIIKKRPSYLMPYFSVKVFQVVMASLTTLGFYSCLSNVRVWIQNHNYFPFKNTVLQLDNQTLELFVFSILLSSILVKLYTVIIIWYCYKYMITIDSFRSMNQFNGGYNISAEDSNNGYKFDDDSLISQPPKYEEIIKQDKNKLVINQTQTSNGQMPSTSTSCVLDLQQSDNEISSGLVPSYTDVVLNKNKIINV